MVSHSRRREWRPAEWQQSNSVGDPADQSVYSADTSSRRCEGLDFSSDRIYCPPRPPLLSTVFQSGCGVIKGLKTSHMYTHTCTHWLDISSVNAEGEINLHLMFLMLANRKMPGRWGVLFKWNRQQMINKEKKQEIRTRAKSAGDSRKQRPPSFPSLVRPQLESNHVCTKHGGLVLITVAEARPPAL